MSSYCDFAPGHAVHGPYHDTEYGFPLTSDNEYFERLVLEIMQAGLNWELILKKREGFTRAFEGFIVETVASYGPDDEARLLADAGIVRNRLKVAAVIENARRIIALRTEYGSFDGWLKAHHPLDKPAWVKLFKKTFKFTGGEITGEFLMSAGYLPGAHIPECPIYAKIEALDPPWMKGV